MINIRYIYIVAILIVATIFTNCNLDELPKSSGSKNAVFESVNGLELYSNSFYEILPTPYDGVFLLDDYSDIIARTSVGTLLLPNGLSPITSSGWTWNNLRNINYFIENCETSELPEKDHFIGLARFFRAYFYFDKVKRFGNVPWIDRTIDVDDEETLYGPRDDRFEVMNNILDDLNFAISNISTTTDSYSTRITKNVVRAFKTRVCLYEASYRKYHTEYNMQSSADEWYKRVIETANEIKGFSLHQGDNAYRELFLQKNPIATETILAVTLDADLQVFSSRNRKTISPTYSNRPSFTRSFINTFLNKDGTPFTEMDNYKTKVFSEEVINRDPRLSQTIRLGNYYRTENGIPIISPPNLEQSYTGYQIIKGCYDERFPYDDESRNENAHLIFRYAEILLNKAEALAELGEMDNTEWANTIGALRERAGIEGSSLTQMPSNIDPYLRDYYKSKFTNPVLLEVVRERAIEMSLEGLRIDDLNRWKLSDLLEEAPMNGMYVPGLGEYDLNGDGKMDVYFYKGTKPSNATAHAFVDVSSNEIGKRYLSNGDSGELIWNIGPREWSDKKYLYPIPEADRIKNPNLGQNPDW